MTITYFDKTGRLHTDSYTYPDGCPRSSERLEPVSNSNDRMRAVLDEAAEIVCGDRQKAYGLPEDNHGRTAALWSVFLGTPITPRQVCYMNILQKCSREVNHSKRDTDVDIAGYAANAAACHTASKV
jgi:hypothetical protein